MTTKKSDAPKEEPVEEVAEETAPAVQTQVPPAPDPVERDPEEWTEPGWEQGMFPGDPNTYPDPDHPTISP